MAAYLTNQDLATQSDLIVIGRAVASRNEWVNDGRNLYTLVKVAVEETLKGEQGAITLVALPGGVDANRRFPIAMTYPGAPRIAPDEEVLLFLSRADDEISGATASPGSRRASSRSRGRPGTPWWAATAAGCVRPGATRRCGWGTGCTLSSFKQEISSYLQ